ncbi:MAG TPA: DUF695 domain-containing protein [Sphingomicrobium sp.]|nr:DUF695 domain-containing protein [Sphingomicrobium sp.]
MTLPRHSSDWKLFGRAGQSGQQLLFRSRTHAPEVREFADQNEMARVRCILAEGEATATGMPKSTKDLDDYEDRLLGKLEEAGAEVYLIAVVSGEGNRDLYFAMREFDQLRAGITAAKTDVSSFRLQIAPIGGDAKASFLQLLTLTPEMEQRAAEAGRVHAVEVERGGGGLIAKLFGRERTVK